MSKHLKFRFMLSRTVLAVMLLCMGLPGFTQHNSTEERVTLLAGNVSISRVLKSIEKQTHRRFNYSEEELNINERVNVSYNDAPLNQVLGQLFSAKGISWKFIDNSIYLRKETNTKQPVPEKNYVPKDSLNYSILSGTVTDEEGTPLPGATILIKGTTTGSMADANGQFSLINIPANAIVRVSYTSFEPKEIIAREMRHLFIRLRKRIGNLDETVVIGYGTTTKRFNTGAISTIKSDVISSQPVTDPLLALQGRVPGLYISQSSGIPGSNTTVLLRGQNSIASGNNPLYIIDNVPVTSSSLTSTFMGGGAVGSPTDKGAGLSPFNNLNPEDIERIDVLKDADATAIYGSRGANGVILITTKKGRPGKTAVDINVYTGAGKVANTLSLLNTPQYLAMRREAFSNDGKQPGASDYDVNGTWDTTRYTDWQKVLIGGTAKLTNAQAAISGGSANTYFNIRGGYSKQSTVFPGDYADAKAMFSFNLGHTSVDGKFRTTFSANYVNDNSNLPQMDLTSNITLAPTAPALYDATGKLNWQNNTFNNPLGAIMDHAYAATDNLVGNLGLNYEILPGLVLKSSLGFTHVQIDQSIQRPLTDAPPAYSDFTFLRSNDYGTNDIKTWIIEPQVDYNKNIGAGKLGILVGGTLQQNLQNMIAHRATDFASDGLIEDVSAAKTNVITGNNYTKYKYIGVFGRVNYNWKEKYIINLTARRDGSSRFGPGKQFGNFGAIGAAWIFSDESWVKSSLPFLSYGKLRASYGTTGNDQISDYQYLSSYSSYYTPYQSLIGLLPTRMPNQDFGWEQVKKIELGIETGLLDNRILLNVDYYHNRTGNQLVGYALPSLSGFTSVQYNLPAVVQNTGIELAISTNNIKSKNFSWRTNFNLTIPNNKLIKYPNLEGSPYSSTYTIGASIFSQKYYEYTGVDPQTGIYTVKDVNNDNIINSSDYTQVRQITQKYYGGLLNTLNYKGFQLDIFLQVVNQTGINYLSTIRTLVGFRNQNVPVEVLKRWTQKGDITDVQKFSTGDRSADKANGWRNNSDASIDDASFVRIKNVMLSYTLPATWLTKMHVRNIRLYAQAQNLVTFTKYNGLDPESKNGLTLPPLRMITGGIQLSL